MGCSCFGAGVLNIPLPNGLVPQAPVHTDSVTVYETELSPSPMQDGTLLNQPTVRATEVKEQRLSAFIMGLALLGTMTGPLLIVLHTIPRGLFGGVFFVVGYGGLEGSGITTKILYLLREPRFVPSDEPLLRVSKRKIMEYLGWQAVGISTTVAISQTIAAIGFPVLITAMIPLRWMILPHLFSAHDLGILDAPTASSEVVLASMGGRPLMPEDKLERRSHRGERRSEQREKNGEERGGEEEGVLAASGSGGGSRTIDGDGAVERDVKQKEAKGKEDFDV